MRTFKYIIAVLLSCILLTACCNGQKNDTIIVSIAPLKYIVEAITAGDFPIEILVPEGSSPETYSPTPAQILSAESAQMIFVTKLIDFETELTSRITKALKDSNIIDLSNGIGLIEGECSHGHHEHGGGHHHNHGADPHIWTSPEQLKVMASNAFAAISAAYPDSLSKYTVNYNDLINRLDLLSESVRGLITESGKKYFAIYHPALTYYAHDYGLEQISIEDEGKEPSATHMKEIIDLMRKHDVRIILCSQESPRSAAEALARETGASVVDINLLREDIVKEIMFITNVIANNSVN